MDLGDAYLWIAPAAGFVVHLTVGRQNARRVARQWQQLPTALDPRGLGQIRSAVECDSETLEIALDCARQADAERDATEAQRQRSIAHAIVGDAVPDRIRRLKALSLVVRMAGALEPLPALPPSSYRLWRLKWLAAFAYVLHSFLFGAAARLLLRMVVLRASFAALRSLLDRLPLPLQESRAQRLFEAAIDDFCTLDRQHLEAVSACLVSSRIQPRIQVLPQRLP